MKHEINELYFRYMLDIVCNNGYERRLSWRKLFRLLYKTEFVYTIDMDVNRADDGIDLRYRFAYDVGIDDKEVRNYLDNHPCTLLEMMIALAMRCEEQIMNDPDQGNRTGKWFFEMIESIGLIHMDDQHFCEEYVYDALRHLAGRNYDASGLGGLFTIRHPKWDMRYIEIWNQMMAYLKEVEV